MDLKRKFVAEGREASLRGMADARFSDCRTDQFGVVEVNTGLVLSASVT